MSSSSSAKSSAQDIKYGKDAINEFLQACCTGSPDEVKTYLNPNNPTYKTIYAAQHRGVRRAAQKANLPVLQFFLEEMKLSPTYHNNMLLFAASTSEDPKIMRYVLNHPIFKHNLPLSDILQCCAYSENLTILEDLIQNPITGMDLLPHQETLFLKAIQAENLNVIEFLLITQDFQVSSATIKKLNEDDSLDSEFWQLIQSQINTILLKNKLMTQLDIKSDKKGRKI